MSSRCKIPQGDIQLLHNTLIIYVFTLIILYHVYLLNTASQLLSVFSCELNGFILEYTHLAPTSGAKSPVYCFHFMTFLTLSKACQRD